MLGCLGVAGLEALPSDGGERMIRPLMLIIILTGFPGCERKTRKILDFDSGVRAECGQSRQRLTASTDSLHPPLGLGPLLLRGHSVFAESLPSGHRPFFVSGRQTGGRAWSTANKVTKMIQLIDPARDARALSAETGAEGTRGVFLPHSTLRSLELLSEPPHRQIAWLRLVAYLIEMGLPFRECRFPATDGFWLTVCGMTEAQMREPNRLWMLDEENRLHLHLDAEEARV